MVFYLLVATHAYIYWMLYLRNWIFLFLNWNSSFANAKIEINAAPVQATYNYIAIQVMVVSN